MKKRPSYLKPRRQVIYYLTEAILHSDQGIRYAGEDFMADPAANGISKSK